MSITKLVLMLVCLMSVTLAVGRSRREAHGEVVRLVLASQVAQCPLIATRYSYLFESKRNLVGAVGIETTRSSETKEFCGAAWPSKVLKRMGGNS
jgi:hypothetical protein